MHFETEISRRLYVNYISKSLYSSLVFWNIARLYTLILKSTPLAIIEFRQLLCGMDNTVIVYEGPYPRRNSQLNAVQGQTFGPILLITLEILCLC